jgi:hypothetical protein
VALDGFKTTGTPDFPATQVNHVNFNLGPDPVTPVNPGVVSIINSLAAAPVNAVSVINNVANNNPPYPCTADSFVYLAAELFTPANNVTVDQNGQTVSLAAIVQPIVFGAAAPTGTINVVENGNVVASAGVVGRITQIPIAGVSSAPHTYTAQYSGDANYAPLRFGSVTMLDTSTTLVSSTSQVVYGNSISLNASVISVQGAPAGTVTFKDGEIVLGKVPLNVNGTANLASIALPAGNHFLSASYSGGGNFEASTTSINVVVTPATLTLSADNLAIVFGDPLPAFTYTPTGFVNGDTAAVISGIPQFITSATSTSPVATYPIMMAPGTLAAANYTFAFVSGTLTVSQATPSLILSCPVGIIHDGHRHSCAATVTGAGGASVNGSLVITYNGSLRPPSKVGAYNVVAVFTSGDPNYTNVTATASLVIERRPEDDDGNDDSQ